MGLNLDRPVTRVLSCTSARLGSNNSDNANRLCCYGAARALVCAVCCWISVTIPGWAGESKAPQKVITGVVATADGAPLVGATVALVDLSGNELANTTSGTTGEFEISTNASPGQYELIVTNSLQLNDERITLGRTDLQIELTVSTPRAAAPHSANAVSVGQLSMPEKARHAVVMAQEHFKADDYSAAMREINEALRLDSTSSEAWSMRAVFKLSGKDFRGAVGDATQSVQLDPHNASAFLVLGTAHNSLREFQAAAEYLKRAVELDRGLWQAQLELAKTWYGEKRFVLSLRELDLIHQEFADVHLVRANVLMSLNRTDEGAREFERFLQLAPNDPRNPQIRQILARANGPE